MKTLEIIESESSSSQAIAESVREDPFMAGRIVEIANIRKSHRSGKIESLEHAITFIGRQAVTEVVMAAFLSTVKLKTKNFDSKLYWDSCLLIGCISEDLLQKFPCDVSPDEAFLGGCLSNIGKLVQAIFYPRLTDCISRDISDPENICTWAGGESRYGLYSHTVLGAIGASIWGLPNYVIECSRLHHTCNVDAEICLSDITGFANQLRHWIFLQPECIEEELLVQYRQKFSLSEDDVEDLASELAQLKAA